MKDKILIVPDVHGRDFWKDVEEHKDSKIIFLGDYLSPYDIEGISNERAIEVFKEIIKFKKENMDRVTLLVGNHDLSYIVGRKICSCRVDDKNYDEIRKLFWDNTKLFQMTLGLEAYGKKFLFSHAGYTKNWVTKGAKELFMTDNLDMVLNDWDYLNRSYKSHSEILHRNIKQISQYRGGWDLYGSVVWADIKEHLDAWTSGAQLETDWIQVFGHSWCKQAVHGKCEYEWYMLDCREVFYIDEDGTIKSLVSNKPVEMIGTKKD